MESWRSLRTRKLLYMQATRLILMLVKPRRRRCPLPTKSPHASSVPVDVRQNVTGQVSCGPSPAFEIFPGADPFTDLTTEPTFADLLDSCWEITSSFLNIPFTLLVASQVC